MTVGKNALLVMDVQRVVVDHVSGADGAAGYLPRLREAIDGARAADVPVIYVVIGFRPGHPEISDRNRSAGAAARNGWFLEGNPGAEIHPDAAPRPGDIVVTKKRVSAFTGSDLDVVLRSGGIDGLVLTGLSTSGVVLSTLRQAADLDFRLTVLADGCLDPDAEVHRVLLEKVFPRHAEVTTVAAWLKTL
jgi:nicotinamidase-related amidase